MSPKYSNISVEMIDGIIHYVGDADQITITSDTIDISFLKSYNTVDSSFRKKRTIFQKSQVRFLSYIEKGR